MTRNESENGKILGGPGFTFRKHIQRTKWESVKRAIYNPETKQFIGRTAKGWGQLLLFYAIFYSVLAAVFAICMLALLNTVGDKEPMFTLSESLIGTSPGMGFRPIPNKTEDGSLIWYNMKNKTSVKIWVDRIKTFLSEYEPEKQMGPGFTICGYNKTLKEDQVCYVDASEFGKCNEETDFGYSSGDPCIFLKLNKIIKWTPECYTEPEKDMPDDLKKTILDTSAPENQKVWVSCRGENPHDRENVRDFEYFPKGFPAYYYPYKNNKNYSSPLVAVQIKKPKNNIAINIECRAWARNIKYVGGNLLRQGSVHFEIMVDNLPIVDKEDSKSGGLITNGNSAPQNDSAIGIVPLTSSTTTSKPNV